MGVCWFEKLLLPHYHSVLFGTGEISIHLPKPLMWLHTISKYFILSSFCFILKFHLCAFQPLNSMTVRMWLRQSSHCVNLQLILVLLTLCGWAIMCYELA
ncbi:CLUMA_CG001141, isoform A [Clunio marinus]|uniref:CLUMA_CG001141, isoform A n=1 Tax=Clunio marinus TaxID=568069 RepID=A0A1J1HHI0_9DIPT|nr:CLUMA_CG001141, isoform A [Clunio marinus]